MENNYIKKDYKKIFILSTLSWRFFVLFFMMVSSAIYGQKTWDGGAGTSNWGDGNNWNPNGVPASGQTVTIANGVNVTVNVAAVCSTFTIAGGNSANTITISGTNSLTVSGAVAIGAGTGTGDNKILSVGTGTLSCSSISITAAGNFTRTSGITLSSGIVNVIGSITMGDVNDDFTFTGTGTLNVGGTITGGTLTPSTGTVNYNGSGNQMVGAYTHNNLTLSTSSSTKTFGAATTINGNLTINTNVVANLGTFTHSVGSLNLGGLGTASGSWGSTSSSPIATNLNDTFFALTTGKVNVTNDTRPTALFSNITASTSVCIGTATTTLSGVVSNGSAYATNGKNVVVTVNGVSQNAVISGGSGGFSASYNTSALPASTYTITYAYAGDGFLKAATNNTSTSLTVSPVSTVGVVSANQSVCSGSSPSTNLTIASATGTIQWQKADDSGFTSNLTNLGTNSTTLTIAEVGALATAKYFRAVVTSGACTSAISSTIIVDITANNTVSTASSTPTLCISTALSPVITHTTTGAIGISNNGVSGANGLPAGLSATWSAGTITISGTPSASGIFNYSIPLTGGCGSVNATGTITVNANNTVGAASAAPNLCINTALPSSITHSTTGATGIGTPLNLPAGVSASFASNTITISGTPTASGIFNYSIPLAGGCGPIVYAIGTLTVQDPVGAAGVITGTATVCQGQNAIAYSVPLIANTTSYNWTLPSGATIVSGLNTNSITVNFAANASSGDVVVSGNNICGSGVSVSFPVIVNTISTAPTGITGTTTICNGDSTTLSVTGGVLGIGAAVEWFTGSCNGTSAGTGNSITVSPATTTTYYARYSGTCNTTVCISVTVTVNTLSAAPTGITGNTTICEGASTTLNVSGGTAGTAAVAQWFTGSCGGTSAGTGNSITVSPTITTTYFVRYSGTCNTTACASVTVNVDPLPFVAASITGASTVCQGQTGVAYSVPLTTNATSYIWTLPPGATIASGAGTNAISVDYATNATNGNITVKGTNSCGNGGISTFGVTVNFLPTAAGAISGTAIVCQGQNNVTYSVPVIANAVTYNWTLPTGASIVAGANSNSITVNYSVAATSGDITVYGVNPCGNGIVSANYAVTVNPLPVAAGIISGTGTVCQGQIGVVYSVPAIANATAYTWTLPAGATIATGANTNSITVNYSVSATFGNVTVNGTNACGNGVTANFPVTVNPLPATAGTISGPTPVCQGQLNAIYTVPAIANATNYNWILPLGASIISGAGTNSITVNYSISASSGSITVQGTNACGNGIISANYPVTVNITPSITTNYSPAACSGLAISVTPPNGGGNIVPAGTTYSWGLPAVTGGITGATALSAQTAFNQTLVNPTNTVQTASYSVTATTGGCSATTFSILVTVYPKPTISATPLTQSICSGGAISAINFSNPNGVAGTIDYNWTRDNTSNLTGIAVSGSGAITGNLTNTTATIQTTVFTVIASTQNGCESLPFTVSVAVNPIPTVLATPSTAQSICSGDTISPIGLSNPNAVAGTTYSWTRTNNNANLTGIPDGTGSSITGALINTTNSVITTVFTITASANGCPSSTTTVAVTVNPKPTVAATNTTQNICGNDSIIPIVISNPNSVVGTVLSWTRDNGAISSGNVTGIASSGTGSTISGTLVNTTSVDQTVIFTVRAQSGSCFSITTATITVKHIPAITFANANQIICSATAIAPIGLSDSNNASGTTYTWTRDNGAVSSGNITGLAASGSGPIGVTTLTNTTTTTQTTIITVIATGSNGCKSTSTTTITIYPPLVAPVIASSQDICTGQTPSNFYMSTNVTGGSGSYKYQWQFRKTNPVGTWANVALNGTSATYFPNNSDENDYRLIVTDNYCSSKNVTSSNTVYINVLGLGGLFDQATLINAPNLPVCNGVISPAIGAEISHSALSNVKFYYSVNNSYITPASGGPVGTTTGFIYETTKATFNFTAANNTNATVTSKITITPQFSNFTGTCNSTPATIDVQIRPTPVATATVSPTTICNGSSPGISVRGNITDAPTTFNWTRDNFVNVTGTGDATPISSGAVAAGGTYLILGTLNNITTTPQTVTYSITPVSNGCSGATITVVVTVAPTVTPGTIGTNQIICYGDTPAGFTEITPATGLTIGVGTPTYQWQSSTDNVSYNNISGATGIAYAPGALTQNTWYRRIVTSILNGVSCAVATTTPVTVTINSITPGTVAGTQAVCNGSVPTGFTSASLGTGSGTIKYQWQISTTGADCITGFTDIIGATGASYTSTTGLTVTTYYRRKDISVLSGKECFAYSNCITVSINNVTAGTIAGDQTLCGNNPDAFTEITAATGSGILTYQWQSNTTGCTGTFGDISGANSATYDAPPGLLVTTYYRRITISTLNGVACSVSGNCITVTANTVTAGAISGNRTVCSGGDPAAFTETAVATGTGLVYQWQYSLVGGAGPWTDVTGAKSATYDAPGPISQTTYFQRQVKSSVNGTDCFAYSGFVTVFVNDVTPSVIAGSQDVCGSADPVAFTVSTAALGTGTLSYQWQSSTTSASGPWNNISLATNSSYDPVPVTQTTYYQVVITSTLNGVQCTTISNNVMVNYLALPATPIVGTITQPDCITPTGTVVLSGLPAGNWTVNPGGITGNTSSVTISGLAANTYNFTVNNGTCTSLATINVVVQPATTAIWNGSGWTNGPPASNQAVEFRSDYTLAADMTACSCTVTNGAKVVIASANTLTITNQVNVVVGSSLTFENNSSLVQINNVTNSGSIIYIRKSAPMKNFDYTYWSSPVVGQTLVNLSPNTLADKYHSFSDPDWFDEAGANVMTAAKGYIIRTPKAGLWPNGENVSFPYAQEVNFIGTPNNGNYGYVGIQNGKSYLIGNPYPSAVDADAFLIANNGVLDGTIYFWTHNTNIAPSGSLYVYSDNDYASYNLTGGTGVTAPAPSDPDQSLTNPRRPNGKIAAGQSFFTDAISSGTANFTNTMRLGGGVAGVNNAQFFRTKGNAKTKTTIEKNRVWLNLSNTQGAFKQTLVGYISGATNDYDNAFDGESFDGNEFVDFYSVTPDKNLVIQGRALPFDETDTVPLGYRSTMGGEFTISIEETDGLFASQNIYIEDKLLNVIHNLKTSSYNFTTKKGVVADRFVLRYTDRTLSVKEMDAKAGIIAFFSTNKKSLIIRNSLKDVTVHTVFLYNMLGQKIESWDVKGREQTNIEVPIKALSAEIYIVKIKTTKGEFSKKIIYNE